MYKLVGSPKTFPITKKLAEEFATMPGAPRDRPLSEKRIGIYEKLIAADAFYPCVWSRVHCKETGETYRANGKHTSTMFSRMEKIPGGMHVVVQEFAADTLDDVARLYSSFDSKISSRKTSDINSSFAGTLPELIEVRNRIINLTISGLSYYMWQDSYSTHPPTERAELLLEQSSFCLFLSDLLTGNNCKPMMKIPVAAAIFGTFKKAQKDCVTFWTAVRDETGPKPDLPCRKLAKVLSDTKSKLTGISPVARKLIANRAIYVKSIHAWNAWRRQQTTDLKYRPDCNIPAFA